LATEQGVVTKIGPDTAWVKTTKSGACESCSSRGSCHSLGGGNDMEVEAANPVGAKVGDTVIIGFETTSLVKLTFLIYIFPIISMGIGAVIGNETGPGIGWDPSDFSALLGFTFLFASFLLIRFLGKGLEKKKEYQAYIVRIKKGKPSPVAEEIAS